MVGPNEVIRAAMDVFNSMGLALLVLVLSGVVFSLVVYRNMRLAWEIREERRKVLAEYVALSSDIAKVKRKREVMLGADGEIEEIISDEERSEGMHESFHDENPNDTPSPDLPFAKFDDEVDYDFWS